MVADELDYVVGVDTHLDEHVLAVVAAPTGAVAGKAVGAGERARLLGCAAVRERGSRRCSRLGGRGHGQLWRRSCPLPGRRRRDGARDRPHATSGAATARQGRCARRGPDSAGGACQRDARSSASAANGREALRLLLLARRSAVDVRREALTQLRGVIVTAPDRLREQLRVLPVGRLLERCSRLRRSSSASPDELATRIVLRSLARRIQAATVEADELEQEILGHDRALAPRLLDEPGVGPIVAAQLIVAWSHHGRVRSEAAFARLAGVAPLPASSGQTTRHRLSRGGDRQLNRALHTVILHRRQYDPATKEYIARRIADGKSRRDAIRLLKRYLARHLYRLLQNQEPLTT